MNIAYYDCAEIRFVLIATVSAVVTERVHHLSARVERCSCLSSIVETQASQAETATLLYSSGDMLYCVCYVCFNCSKNEIRNAMIQNVYLTKLIELSFLILNVFSFFLSVP